MTEKWYCDWNCFEKNEGDYSKNLKLLPTNFLMGLKKEGARGVLSDQTRAQVLVPIRDSMLES